MSKSSLKNTLNLLVDASQAKVESSIKTQSTSQGEYCFIPLDSLVPGQFQPRKNFNQELLKELSTSIAREGVLQPLIVRISSEGKYEIIAGERRWRASRMAGLTSVPVIIRDVDDESALAFGILENLQRDDLNPIEEADSFKRLINDFSLTHDEVAKRLGKSRVYISNSLRLLKLPECIQKHLIEGVIQTGHGKALLASPEEIREKICNEIINKKLSVRQTEKLVQNNKGILKLNDRTDKKQREKLALLESELFFKLKAPATVKLNNSGNIKVELFFSSIDELENYIS